MKSRSKNILAVVLGICMAFTLATVTVKAESYISDFSAVIKEDGSLWVWGFVTSYEDRADAFVINFESTPVKILDDVDMVSVKHNELYAVKTDASLWLWQEGLLSDYNAHLATTPVKVMDGVASVQANSTHLLVIRTDGSLWVKNGIYRKDGKQFFDPFFDPTDSAIWLKAMDNVIYAQSDYAIKADGSLWDLQLSFTTLGYKSGIPEYEFTSTPVKVMDDVVYVSEGKAIKSDGSLWSWGSNSSGQVGDGSGADVSIDNAVKIMDDVALVSENVRGVAAVKTDGSLFVWGEDRDGRLGLGTSWGDHATPIKIADDVAYAELTNRHIMVIKQDGSLWTSGRNEFGQLGEDTSTSSPQILPWGQNGQPIWEDSPTRPYLEKVMDGVKLPSNAVKPTISVLFENQKLNLTLPILNISGRTMYPFRECLEAMGADVTWDEDTRTAKGTLNGNTVEFVIDSGTYQVNGRQFQMDTGVTAFICDGRTYIPIRYAAEGLGFTVNWEETTLTINIK